MSLKIKRIIIDTNLWISFLITNDFNKLDQFLDSGKYQIVFSEELFNEFLEVVHREKFNRYFNNLNIKYLIEIINDKALFVKVISIVNECRDLKDNFLLSLAIDGEVDYLITGDNDLLSLKHFKKTSIITINDFFQTPH
jgi:putative PIN family toxin of toxin-antitoxin system